MEPDPRCQKTIYQSPSHSVCNLADLTEEMIKTILTWDPEHERSFTDALKKASPFFVPEVQKGLDALTGDPAKDLRYWTKDPQDQQISLFKNPVLNRHIELDFMPDQTTWNYMAKKRLRTEYNEFLSTFNMTYIDVRGVWDGERVVPIYSSRTASSGFTFTKARFGSCVDITVGDYQCFLEFDNSGLVYKSQRFAAFKPGVGYRINMAALHFSPR